VTLKLVHDAESVAVTLTGDIASQLRAFADAVEAGEYGEVVTVYTLIDTPDNLHTEVWGEDLTRYEAIGLLEFAKRAALGEDYD